VNRSLPDGFTTRPLTPDDAPAANELVVAVDEAVRGSSDSTDADLLDWWRSLELEENSWLVEDGAAAAFAVLRPHGEIADFEGFVHPEQKGRGLGTWLLERGENRARECKLERLQTWCLTPDLDARRLFEARGYREVRRFFRMLIELDAAPPAAEWPDGFTVDTFKPEDARAFHAALDDAFAEEWNFVPEPFERWAERRIENAPTFDPTLWFIVRDGDEIAAVLRGDPEVEGSGWVGALGVRKPWRKRGLGLALLHHAFGVFYGRGQPRIALGVDAQNPTGATRLYERAGMHVTWEAVCFEGTLA
jgi:mycothiol synthase